MIRSSQLLPRLRALPPITPSSASVSPTAPERAARHRFAPPMDAASLEQLRLLKAALDEGLLSPAEHAAQKQKLLDAVAPAPHSVGNSVPSQRCTPRARPPAAQQPVEDVNASDPSAAPDGASAPLDAPASTGEATPTHRRRHRPNPATPFASLASSRPVLWVRRAVPSGGAVLMSLAVLAVYAASMPRSAAGGDATEFAFIACDGSVAHPPGYPTFTMLATISQRAFAAAGWGPAFGSNFASAACGAAAAGVVFAAVRTAVTAGGVMGGGGGGGGGGGDDAGGGAEGAEGWARGAGVHAAAMLGSGLFALSRNVWMYSMQSEVFGLNNLFVALAILFAVRFGANKPAAVANTNAGETRRDARGAEGEADGGSFSEEASRPIRGLREALAGALTCGLAMTNQHTFVLFGTPLALWVLATGRDAGLWRPKSLAAMFIAPLAGLVPYAYIVYASGRGLDGSSTPGAWGATHTLSGFVTHVLRKEYGTFRLYSGASRGDHRMWLGLRRYASNLAAESLGLAPVFMAVAAVAAVAPGKRSRPVPGVRPVLAAYLAYTVGFQYMANLPIEKELYLGVAARFWMQSDVAAGFITGVGAALALASVINRLDPEATVAREMSERGRGGKQGGGRGQAGRSRGSRGKDVVSRVSAPDTIGDGGSAGKIRNGRTGEGEHRATRTVELAAFGLALALLVARLGTNFSSMDERNNDMFEQFGREMLRPLPANAKLIVRGDLITNSARYVQRCLHYRRDVQMVDMAMLTYRWFIPTQGPNFPGFTWPGTHYHPYEPTGFSMKGLLDANFAADPGAPIFLAGGWHDEDFSYVGAYDTRPYGIADKIYRVGAKPIKPRSFLKKVTQALPNITFPSDALVIESTWQQKYPEGRWERVVVKDYFQSRHKVAYTLLNWGLSTSERHATLANQGQAPPVKETHDVVWAFERCVEVIEGCLESHPRPVPSFYYRNLGICHQRLWGMQPAKQEHHAAMIRAFRGYINAGSTEPNIRNEGGFDAISDIVRQADEGRIVA